MLAITRLGIGGAESQVRDLAIAYKRLGHFVSVVSLRAPEAHIKELNGAGIEIRSLGMESPLHLAQSALRLVGLCRAVKPDIVHAHCYHANIVCRLSKLLMPRIKLVCTAHSTFEISRKRGSASRGIRDTLYRFTDCLSNFNTHVSQAGLDRYLKAKLFKRANSKQVSNGIAVSAPSDEELRAEGRRKLGWDQDSFVWFHAGRFTAAKNQALLLEAFAAVAQSQPNALLAIAGDGELKDQLQETVAELGIGCSVSFLGLRDDVPDLMRCADGFVLSSDWEGLPMVLLEAGMAGTPCVATNVGSIADALGESNLLVPAGDNHLLAQAMLTLMDMEPDERRQIGSDLRSRMIERYSIDSVVSEWLGIYADVARRPRQ